MVGQTERAKHTVLGGKVHLYKRPGSPKWQCAAYIQGKNHRTSTKTDSLAEAPGAAVPARFCLCARSLPLRFS